MRRLDGFDVHRLSINPARLAGGCCSRGEMAKLRADIIAGPTVSVSRGVPLAVSTTWRSCWKTSSSGDLGLERILLVGLYCGNCGWISSHWKRTDNEATTVGISRDVGKDAIAGPVLLPQAASVESERSYAVITVSAGQRPMRSEVLLVKRTLGSVWERTRARLWRCFWTGPKRSSQMSFL